MKKSNRALIQSIVFMALLVFACLYYVSKIQPTPKPAKAVVLPNPPEAPAPIEPQMPAEQVKEPVLEKSKKDQEIEDESTSKMLDEMHRNSFGACKYVDGLSDFSRKVQKNLIREKSQKARFERHSFLSYYMAIADFQLNLPVNEQFYELYASESTRIGVEYELWVRKKKLELVQNFKRAQAVALRSYYAFILANIAYDNPQMIGDPELAASCKKLKNMEESLSRQQMNEMVYSFMQRADVKPRAVKFNPRFSPNLEIRDSAEGPNYFEKTRKENL